MLVEERSDVWRLDGFLPSLSVVDPMLVWHMRLLVAPEVWPRSREAGSLHVLVQIPLKVLLGLL